MGIYTDGTRRGSVECCRVRATTLVVLWRRQDGVEGKSLFAHTCLSVLFSQQRRASENIPSSLTSTTSTHPTRENAFVQTWQSVNCRVFSEIVFHKVSNHYIWLADLQSCEDNLESISDQDLSESSDIFNHHGQDVLDSLVTTIDQ